MMKAMILGVCVALAATPANAGVIYYQNPQQAQMAYVMRAMQMQQQQMQHEQKMRLRYMQLQLQAQRQQADQYLRMREMQLRYSSPGANCKK